MAISRVKVWIAGEVLTASDLNAEFNNILNNAASMISPLGGNLVFTPDATYDIGASGLTRPRNLYLSGAITAGGALSATNATLATGTITTSQPESLTQTWNAGGVTFDALTISITDTASAAASRLLRISVGGSDKLVLDKAGNLGLGVTPATGVTGYAEIQIGNANLVGRTGNTTNSEMYLLANSTVDDKYIGTDYAAMFSSNDGAFYWKTAASGTAGNAISWTTVLSIDANGCLSGTASSGYAATFNNTNAAGAGVKVHYTNTINDATHYFVFFDDPDNTRAACLSNGNWQNINNSYGATSDRKLKQDIVLAGSQLSDVLALSKVVSKFRRKAEPTGPLQIGFVAQDVLAVSPGLVEECPDLDADGNPNGEVTLAVKYSIAYMKNLKATGELIERTDDHESRLTQDRTDIDSLTEKNKSLESTLAKLVEEFNEYRKNHQ